MCVCTHVIDVVSRTCKYNGLVGSLANLQSRSPRSFVVPYVGVVMRSVPVEKKAKSKLSQCVWPCQVQRQRQNRISR